APFTLRLASGSVQGWPYQGQTVTPFTTFGGLYARATDSEPFRLPQRWRDAKSKLDLNTPLDVSTNNDIFDGNIHSLGGDFGFDPRLNRAIAVLTAAIGPALRNVYALPALADELESD